MLETEAMQFPSDQARMIEVVRRCTLLDGRQITEAEVYDMPAADFGRLVGEITSPPSKA
jgi:protein-disulfide isomerase-like protein with CxxC motif